MAIYIEDQNHAVVGYIEGNRIEDQNHATVIYIEGNHIQNENHETMAYTNRNSIENENHAIIGYSNGNQIENSNHAIIGYINGTATDIQKGAAGIWLLTVAYANSSSNIASTTSSSEKQQSGGGLALLGKILGFLFIHPIGNIVLGLLWLMNCIFNMAGGFHRLGFYIREGGWGALLIGVIVMAVGIFRTIRRYRK